jgi:tetratricopeptide (TPR) repeat protein
VDLRLSPVWKNAILILVLTVGVSFCLHTLWSAHQVNGSFGFPLDDSWIHLQFARNLHDYGAFSYYKNEMSTAGSTSPLYTILLAIGFFFTSNEFVLSYSMGILALVAAAFIMYKLVLLLYGNSIIALAAPLLLVIEPRLEWIALSGMETTLFIALLLAALYFYYSKKSIPFGITSGLLLWTRPEAIILFAVLVLDIFYHSKLVKRVSDKKHQNTTDASDLAWIKRSGLYALILVGAYVVFNLYLSGSIFPNTFAAKLKFYSVHNNNFISEVFHYLSDGHMFIPSIFVAISLLVLLWKIKKRQDVKMLVPFLWSLLLFIAYWKNLSKLFQNGRYLMPLLPCFLLMSVDGMKRAFDSLTNRFRKLAKPKRIVSIEIMLALIISIQFGMKILRDDAMYIDLCGYINGRQVKTAFWIRDNLPNTAVVATHDIGAIAFYSGCRIVDMVGLVSPEMINNIGRIDLLMEFLIRNKTTHVATLRNWFEIVNMKPLFLTDSANPEIMEVFKFDPERTHFTSHDASKLNEMGKRYLLMGNTTNALQMFQQSLSLDPLSAPTHFFMGLAARSAGNLKMAEERLMIVSQLQPDYPGLAEQIAELKKLMVVK